MSSRPLEYPIDQRPSLGEALEIAPGVRWLRMPLPFDLDHINLWLLEEDDGWTIVDTGLHHDEIKTGWQLALAAHCGDKPVRRILVTHCHPDHLGLARWLSAKTGAPVSISQGELITALAWLQQMPNFGMDDIVRFYRQHGLDDERARDLDERRPKYASRVDGLPATYHRLFDGQTLEIGGARWQVIVGYGHSPEHVSLHCAEKGLLISGDMLLPRISTNISAMPSTPDDDPLRQFLDSIARYGELPANTLVLPSHGRPFRGIGPRIAELEAHHAARFAAVMAACRSEKTACELIPTLFDRPLDTHQMLFAMGESIAHLNYLWNAGRLTRREHHGLYRFVAV